ncbi:MAG TPA: hypothetical protein VF665_20710 [Longimicrobium sp.]|jgi:hypothetical protein
MPHLRTLAIRALALAGASVVLAAAPAGAQRLPTAEQVVARHLQAIGGRQALNAQQYRHTRQELSWQGEGLTAIADVYQSREGNRFVMKMDAPNMGATSMGYDGQTRWSSDPVSGPRIRHDSVRGAALNQFDFEWNMNFARAFQSMETVGRDTVNGESCIAVRMVAASGHQVVNCFADDDGLLIGATIRLLSSADPIEIRMTFSDYRVFSGIKMPTLTTVFTALDGQVREIMGGDLRSEMRVVSVSTEPIDASVFALPAEVAALKQD